jgi:hypothetical protein
MSRDRVLAAVNFLIEAPNYAALIQEMTKIIERWDTRPMAYSGHLACLNAMLDVGLQSREAFERLVQLIERKRAAHPKVRRTDYQRNLMQARRARMARALALYEARNGTLTAETRERETKAIQARWNAAKRDYMLSQGATTWEERNAATKAFWEIVDRKLEQNLRAARREKQVA